MRREDLQFAYLLPSAECQIKFKYFYLMTYAIITKIITLKEAIYLIEEGTMELLELVTNRGDRSPTGQFLSLNKTSSTRIGLLVIAVLPKEVQWNALPPN